MVSAAQIDLKLHIFQSGYCLADAHVVNPQAPKGKIRFYATWLLLQHPTQGNILFDTGYTSRFQEATRRFPFRFYAWVTPVVVSPQETAVEQLKAIGLSPKDIHTIVISHFHADHIGGMKDFPSSHFICSQKSLNEATTKKGLAAVRKGILPDLVPKDILSRTKILEEQFQPETESVSGLVMYDLFGDGTLKLIELPGHARGMLGIRVQQLEATTIFASDSFWSKETFEKKILPKKRVKLFFDSWQDYVSSYEKLQIYHHQYPEEKILFTHCPKTLDLLSGVSIKNK